jgi:hypothetical protein
VPTKYANEGWDRLHARAVCGCAKRGWQVRIKSYLDETFVILNKETSRQAWRQGSSVLPWGVNTSAHACRFFAQYNFGRAPRDPKQLQTSSDRKLTLTILSRNANLQSLVRSLLTAEPCSAVYSTAGAYTLVQQLLLCADMVALLTNVVAVRSLGAPMALKARSTCNPIFRAS